MEYRKYQNAMVDECLGAELRQKYSSIRPFICLLFYRADCSWSEGLFLGDIMGITLYGKDFLRLFKLLAKRIPKYPVYLRKKYLTGYSNSGKTYISDALLSTDRYNDNLAEMINAKLIVGGMTIDKIRFRMGDNINYKKYSILQVFWGSGISRYRLLRTTNECIQLIKDMIDNPDMNKRKRLDKLLFRFEYEVKREKERIKKTFKRYQIEQFITSNQYNLNDYLCIAACKELGIKTIGLFHYACSLYAGFDRDFFSYMDEDCVWDDEDKATYLKREKIEQFSPNVVVKVVGNPEISFVEMKNNIDSYQRQRAIVLFAPTVFDENELEECLKSHEALYRNVAAYAIKNRYIVYIKYHPADFERLSALETDVVKKNQFVLCPNLPTSLAEVCCRSCIAIGYRTSAIKVAYAYGCQCYDLIMDEKEYCEHQYMDIKTLYIDNIATIKPIGVSDIYPRYECALNISALLSEELLQKA